MPTPATRSQQLEARRRAGYLVICSVAAIMHLPLAITDTPRGDWRPALGVVLSLFLVAILLSKRVSVQTIDWLLLRTADLGALIILAFTVSPAGKLGARESLIFVIFFVLWFGLMPFKSAFWRSVLMYLAITVISLTRLTPDYVVLTYLGFLGLLTGLLSFAGREVQRGAEETSHYATLALTDPLTGIENRRSLYAALQDIYARRTQAEYGVLLMDVDEFKQVNDRYGHDVGDEVLQSVAVALSSCLRVGDRVARWGGEEFLMLVKGSNRGQLEARCEEIRLALTSGDGKIPAVTVSTGGVLGSEQEEVTGLLRTADQRMYVAKRERRGSVRLNEHA